MAKKVLMIDDLASMPLADTDRIREWFDEPIPGIPKPMVIIHRLVDYGPWFVHTNEIHGRPAPWWFMLARNLGHAGWKAANAGRGKYRYYGVQSARQRLADLGRKR